MTVRHLHGGGTIIGTAAEIAAYGVDDDRLAIEEDTGIFRVGGTAVQLGPVLRACPFAWDSPGITEAPGYAVYTPAVGEVVYGALYSVETSFDGTGTKLAIGQFDGEFEQWGGGTSANSLGSGGVNVDGTISLNSTQGYWPLKLTTADPLRVILTQNGDIDAGDPGATVGAGTLYLLSILPT